MPSCLMYNDYLRKVAERFASRGKTAGHITSFAGFWADRLCLVSEK